MKLLSIALLVAAPSEKPSQSTHKLIVGAIALVVLLALIVLLGWTIDNPMLKSGFPGSPATMKANTALCFLLSGVSLGLMQMQAIIKKEPLKKKLNFLMLNLTFLMLLIALLTLSEYSFGWNLGIDQLLFQDVAPSAATPYPGRMGVNTALNFGLTGTAILLLSHPARYSGLAQLLGFMSGLIALLALIGHLFGVNLFQKVVLISTTMAVHTAIAFALLSGIILLLHPQQGFMRSLTSPLMGGLMARRMLPWAIGLPVVLGWLILQGEQRAWYDTAFMSALQVIVMTLTFTVLIGETARAMNRINAVLRQSQVELRQANENLESHVAERTVELSRSNDRLQIELAERNRTEHELRTMSAVMENAVEGISRVDAQGRYTFVNPSYAHTVGYEPEEMLGMDWSRTVYPDDVEPMIAAYHHMRREGKVEAEARGVRKDGSLFYQQLVMIAAFDKQQQFNGHHCFMKDISDRKRAEAYLRQSEAIHTQLAAIVEASDDALIRKGLDGTILSWNRGAEKIFGYTAEEIVGRSIVMLLPPHHVDEIPQILERVQRGESVAHYETEGLRKDGQQIAISITASPIRDETGKVIAAAVVKRDVTNQKQIEAALQLSEKRYRGIVEDQTELIVRFLPDATVLFVNDAYYRYFGLSQDDVIGQSYASRVFEDDLEKTVMLIESMSFENPIVLIEIRTIARDEIRWTQWNCRMIFDAQGQFLEYQAVGRDIHDRKQAETTLQTLATQLEQSNQELQNFAFIASHDLKEPLRTIRNFSNLLQSRCGNQLSDQGKDYISRMQSAAQRMQILIDDLLSLSRVTSQAQPFVSVDLNQVVGSVLASLELKTQETHAVIEVEALPTLTADPTQMQQLLQNLISNALKFHGDQPPVVKIQSQWLRSTNAKGNPTSESLCQISIQDQGIGFDEHYADRIFKIFERLHGRSEYEGTGIGLAVCRKIVERHHGTITAQSSPGRGSIFLITLPIKQPIINN